MCKGYMDGVRVYKIGGPDWKPVRPELTEGVFGAVLPGAGAEILSLTVTRVRPGGRFEAHRDTYRHVLYFFSGTGTVSIEGEEYEVSAGTVVDIPAGKLHQYINTANDELVLLTLNLRNTP